MSPPFRLTFMPAFDASSAKGRLVPAPAADASLRKKAAPAIAVGVWDVNSRLTYLYEMVEAMSGAQPDFRFFEVVALPPMGLEATQEVLAQALRGRPPKANASTRPADLRVVADDAFYARLRRIRRDKGLDYLIGVVGPLIYDDNKQWDEPQNDLHGSFRGRVGLASVDALKRPAAEAGVSFEAAVGKLFLCLLGCMIQGEDMMHAEHRGCLFDYTTEETDLVQSLRAFTLCGPCGQVRFKKKFGKAVPALLERLKEFHPKSSRP